jgi:predicted transcriptional regulator
MASKAVIHTLSDGTTGTLSELAAQAGVSAVTISTRLKKNSNADEVLLKSQKNTTGAVYELSDGSSGTARELSIKANISVNSMLVRLSKSLDAKAILKKPNARKRKLKLYVLKNGERKSFKDIKQAHNLSDSMTYRYLRNNCVLSLTASI